MLSIKKINLFIIVVTYLTVAQEAFNTAKNKNFRMYFLGVFWLFYHYSMWRDTKKVIIISWIQLFVFQNPFRVWIMRLSEKILNLFSKTPSFSEYSKSVNLAGKLLIFFKKARSAFLYWNWNWKKNFLEIFFSQNVFL